LQLLACHAGASTTAQPTVIAVLHRLHGFDQHNFTQLLVEHVEHHARLGVTATVAYAQPGQLPPLLRDAAVLALVASEQLALVRWDVVAPLLLADGTTTGTTAHDAHVAAVHAELSHIAVGPNVRLLHLDVRDRLVLPALAEQPGRSEQVLVAAFGPSGCLASVVRGALRTAAMDQGGSTVLTALDGRFAVETAAALDAAGVCAGCSESAPAVVVNPAQWASVIAHDADAQWSSEVPARCAYVVRAHA
jgi:hypothetical protein